MYKNTTMAALAALTLMTIGCSGNGNGNGDASASNAADTLTRRQKAEIISTLPIPGARGVGQALDVSDLAAERARVMDSIAGVR